MIHGVTLQEHHIPSHYVVLATPYTITNKLIENIASLQHVSSQLKAIQHRPICTVYLQYPENTKLDGSFVDPLIQHHNGFLTEDSMSKTA